MANRQLTEKLLKDHKAHGDQVLEQLNEALEAGSGIKPSDIDLVPCLEQDFGPNWKSKVNSLSDDAMEAIITSGTFNKIAQIQIRTSLRENPKEMYKLSNATPTETRGECEESFKDFGVFSDIQVHEVCELEAGPLYGIATDYLEHPNGKAVAAGLAFTREAMCKDPNGFLMSQIPKLRDAHDQYRENKLIDTLIGYNATYDRSGTLYDLYYDNADATPFASGASGPWINAEASSLICGEDMQNIRNLFYDMTDLVHGRIIEMNMDNLNVWTSRQNRDKILPLLRSTSVEREATCPGSGDTTHFHMTPEVANGMTFNPVGYDRMTEQIATRYSIGSSEAREWIWFGILSDFMAWVYQVRPEVNRCPLGANECQKRIVAVYNSYSKGYAYCKDPQKGLWLTGTTFESL